MATYREPENILEIKDECDVLVIGGGAAGHSAAIAAARAGAEKVIIVERYDFMGGDVTGGYVIMIPALSWKQYSLVRGLQEEWFTRLDKNAPAGSYMCPSLDEIGESSEIKLDRWRLIHGCTMWDPQQVEDRLVRAPYYEPNQLKIEMDAMVAEEPNIKVLYQCWGAKPVMEGNVVKGVICESKQGRHVIMAKVTIDATGDGDLFSQTGCPIFPAPIPGSRAEKTALVWRMGGVDFEYFARWGKDHPKELGSFKQELSKVAGYQTSILPTEHNDIVWFNNWLPGYNCAKPEDVRDTEVTVRLSIRRLIEFCRNYLPAAFRNAYLYDIAPQLGARCSRRLKGEYVMTRMDIACNTMHDDVIAWHSLIGHTNNGCPVELPYGCILPIGVENLLCPGRHLSADDTCIDALNLIPQCVGLGQGAGVAAAVCAMEGTTTHNVNIKRVQYILSHEQDVPLPRQDNTDPQLLADLEACQYGTMTKMAIAAREKAGLTDWEYKSHI